MQKGVPMQGGKEEPSLAEVKDVLRKLQRLDFSDDAGGRGLDIGPDTAEKRSADAIARPKADIRVFDRKHAAVTTAGPKTGSARRIVFYLSGALALVICAGGVLVGAGVVKIPGNLGKSTANEAVQAALVADARRILSAGDVVSARKILLQIGPNVRADAAFMLAQSYDPNYLQSLPNTNGVANRSEATRWYEKWYELAVKSGLEMDSERLQRIIKSMH
jgi:hypothetical protein